MTTAHHHAITCSACGARYAGITADATCRKCAASRPLYGAESCGCWFDNARGIYIGQAVIELAEGHGLDISSEADQEFLVDHEHYCELWNEAEQYMARFAAPGFWFGANESGDWGLWESEKD